MAKFEGVWLLINSGSKKYIGKYNGLTLQSETSVDVRDKTLASGWVTLRPAFEYISQLQMKQSVTGDPVPTGPIAFVLPLDLQIMEVAEVTARVDSFVVITDLSPESQASYRGMVDAANEVIRNSSAARSGLVIPMNSTIKAR